jgi:hypothetical protein
VSTRRQLPTGGVLCADLFSLEPARKTSQVLESLAEVFTTFQILFAMTEMAGEVEGQRPGGSRGVADQPARRVGGLAAGRSGHVARRRAG